MHSLPSMINLEELSQQDKDFYFLIQKLPKPELHIHPSGSVNPETLREIISADYKNYGAALKDRVREFMVHDITSLEYAKDEKEEIKPTVSPQERAEEYISHYFDPLDFGNASVKSLYPLMMADDDCTCLHDYLRKLSFPQAFMQTAPNIKKIATQFIVDLAADGVTYTEPRISPLTYTQGKLTPEKVIAAWSEGFDRGVSYTKKEMNKEIEWRMILTGLRQRYDNVEQTLEIAKELKSKYPIVGVDLAGPEDGHPVDQYFDLFCTVFEHGLKSTIHAGEDHGANSILQAITHGNAKRLGHATSLVGDEALLHAVVDHDIRLECMITCNEQTGSIAIEDHPVRTFEQLDALWFLCTDNTTVSNTTLTNEYFKAAKAYSWDTNTVVKGIVNGYKSAFLPRKERKQLVKKAITQIQKLDLIVPR